MTKIIALTMAIALIICCFAGCGTNEASEKTEVLSNESALSGNLYLKTDESIDENVLKCNSLASIVSNRDCTREEMDKIAIENGYQGYNDMVIYLVSEKYLFYIPSEGVYTTPSTVRFHYAVERGEITKNGEYVLEQVVDERELARLVSNKDHTYEEMVNIAIENGFKDYNQMLAHLLQNREVSKLRYVPSFTYKGEYSDHEYYWTCVTDSTVHFHHALEMGVVKK